MKFLAAFFDKTGLRKFAQVYYFGLHIALIMAAGWATPIVLPRDKLHATQINTFIVIGMAMVAYEFFLILGISHFFRKEKSARKWLVLAMLILPVLMLYSAWLHSFYPVFVRTS